MSMTFNMVGSGSGQSGSVSVESLSVSANGTYIAPSGTAYSPVTVNVQSSAEEKDVNFIDYDGTILYSYTAEEANALTALPSNPSHSGLTAQGWNWTLAEIKSQVENVGGIVWVGQMYTTDDGKTRIYCRFEEERKSPYIGLAVNGTVVVNWGDGSEESTITGTSTSTVQYTQHSYSSGGNYVISIEVTSGEFLLSGDGTNYAAAKSYLFKKATSGYSNENNVYLNCVRKVEIGQDVTIGDGAFAHCGQLETITIPNGISIGSYALCQCYPLKSITIPSSISSVPAGLLYYCYALKTASIGGSSTEIGNAAFVQCYSLRTITIPNSVTRIVDYSFSGGRLDTVIIPSGVSYLGRNVFSAVPTLAKVVISPDSLITAFYTYVFNNCESLVEITIPPNVTEVGTYAFYSCTGLKEIHVLPTTPPAVVGSTTFSNIPSDCIIYVPYSADHSVLAAYQSATIWSTYASYMQEEQV